MGNKKKSKITLGKKLMVCILIMQVLVMFVVAVYITRAVTENTEQNTIDYMKTMVLERSEIVKSYVSDKLY